MALFQIVNSRALPPVSIRTVFPLTGVKIRQVERQMANPNCPTRGTGMESMGNSPGKHKSMPLVVGLPNQRSEVPTDRVTLSEEESHKLKGNNLAKVLGALYERDLLWEAKPQSPLMDPKGPVPKGWGEGHRQPS